jgi:deoxyribodipyrimidine photo-lyase
MQQSQRVHYNHALMHAIELANDHDLPVVVFFGLTSNYPLANARHYQFMLEGLKEVKELLTKLHIHFVFRIISPEVGVMHYLKNTSFLVMDYGYLKHQKQWRKFVLDESIKEDLACGIDLVDTDVIVPVRYASQKAEYGAYTLRPKLTKIYRDFRDFKTLPVVACKKEISLPSDDDLHDIEKLIYQLPIDHSIEASPIYRGGYLQASQTFSTFLMEKANHYNESNDPSKGLTSKMSMYLHFGQISSLELLERLFLAQAQGHIQGESFDQYLEQLLIRRELAFNFVTYQKGYDQFETMTEPWAYQTMKAHEYDFRPYLYEIEDYISFKTHDSYFNAAMIEMVKTGYMHNYMRMYWAKKIIEWSPNYHKAFETIKFLNDTYFIDGRDPNSYAGIAWCFGKHDRAWTERDIFGKLRYMNDKGLARKFDIEVYVSQMTRYLG